MLDETAGDPMTGLKWTRKTTQKIAEQLQKIGINISRNSVGRLLSEMDFSLKVNHKKLSKGSKVTRETRNEQFLTIDRERKKFIKAGDPIISVDGKKKELIGEFKNHGTTWRQTARAVKDHDFKSESEGKAAPYGVYDYQANKGFISLGTSSETAEFAVDSIEKWWITEGNKRYPNAKNILILADSGGSNGCSSRLWKYEIQKKLSDQHRLTVTICHYPTGASKWNPIEHRLFSEISKNWAGRPLESFETALKYIRTTKTKTGLTVTARHSKKNYETGIKVTDQELAGLNLFMHPTLPKWNYKIKPTRM
ncbi:MAG: ISAzo13 family transposase [Patescibacteria group bacterium]